MPRAEITIDLERAQRVIDDAQRDLDEYAPDLDLREFRTLITEAQRLLLAVDGLLGELAQATERERIAAAAYDGQQSSQRELEALYQAATERAERAENRQRDMVRTLVHTYMRLFPTFEFVSYEQALAVIEREWGGMQAVLDRADDMANALVAYFNKRGADHSMRKGNEDIGDLADALSNYGPLRNAEMDARREQGGML